MGVPDMDEPSFTDSELDYHVRNALKTAIQGDRDFYNQLVSEIHHNKRLTAEEAALLVTCLKAVTGAVSCMHIVHHNSLLGAIFGMSLWSYSANVLDVLLELIVSLSFEATSGSGNESPSSRWNSFSFGKNFRGGSAFTSETRENSQRKSAT